MIATERTTATGKRSIIGTKTTDATRPAIETTTTDEEEISAEMTNIGEGTTTDAVILTVEMTIIAATTIMTETKTSDEMITEIADSRGITTGTTGRRMSTRSDGDQHTTIDADPDL